MPRFIAPVLAGLLALSPAIADARGHGSGSSSYRSSSSHLSHSHRSTSYKQGSSKHRSSKAKRDPAQRAAFQKSHPCPSTGKHSGACPGYVVDHVLPLKRGGADQPSNMQWQTTEAAKQKDKWE
jgi:hypothetical protein